MRRLFILCLVLSLAGCSYNYLYQSNEAMAAKTLGLVGTPVSGLIGAIGYPDEIKDYSDNELYTWSHAERNGGSTAPDLFCELNVEVSEGMIVGASHRGSRGACSTLLAFEFRE